MRTIARRVQQLTLEERELKRELETLVSELAPDLLTEPGVGPISAAQILISWSHPGRVPTEAAFARLAGSAPIPASSGQTTRHRLDRGGDRQLNRALHTIIMIRRNSHAPTIAYIDRRNPRRQNKPRSRPLPQALPRPPPLPATPRSAHRDLTSIEASPGSRARTAIAVSCVRQDPGADSARGAGGRGSDQRLHLGGDGVRCRLWLTTTSSSEGTATRGWRTAHVQVDFLVHTAITSPHVTGKLVREPVVRTATKPSVPWTPAEATSHAASTTSSRPSASMSGPTGGSRRSAQPVARKAPPAISSSSTVSGTWACTSAAATSSTPHTLATSSRSHRSRSPTTGRRGSERGGSCSPRAGPWSSTGLRGLHAARCAYVVASGGVLFRSRPQNSHSGPRWLVVSSRPCARATAIIAAGGCT